MRRAQLLKVLLRIPKSASQAGAGSPGQVFHLIPASQLSNQLNALESRCTCQHRIARHAHIRHAPRESSAGSSPGEASSSTTAEAEDVGVREADICSEPQPERLFKPDEDPLEAGAGPPGAEGSLSQTLSPADELAEEYDTVSQLPEDAELGASPQVDLNYRSPTEQVWPASKRQQKFASRVRDAMELALLRDRVGGDLIGKHGFGIEEIRMDPDNAKAFILWNAYPHKIEAAQSELKRRLPAIRRSVAKYLKTRRVPQLEFRLNAATERQEELEGILQRLDFEQRRDQN